MSATPKVHEKKMSMYNASVTPCVSVIMPTRNQCMFISQAISSVLSQSYSNIELLVIDGCSTDGTIEILKQQSAQDGRLRWISESDTGPGQALNKGLSRVRGEIVGWLNSDDLYTKDAIQRAVDAFQSDDSLLMVYGEGSNIDESGTFLSKYPTIPPNVPIERFGFGCFVSQPTVFFLRAMNILLGPIDESLRASFDFDYWLRAFKAFHSRIGFIPAEQANSRLYDSTITVRNRKLVMLEGMQLLKRHLDLSPKEWVLTYTDEIISMKNIDRRTAIYTIDQFFEEAKHYLDQADQVFIKQKINLMLSSGID